jgi:curli production assembly/transport component CsgG
MVKLIMVMLTALMVSACQTPKSKEQLDVSETVEIITKKRINDLATLPNLDGNPISIAVYKFSDMTGQRKPAQSFASLSSAVTQGSEVFLIKALQDAGNGKWFKVVERVGLDNLVKERQIIRSQRELYEKEEAKPLTPLIVAGVMIEGGVVGYDSNVTTGGLGARILGIGASQEYRKDEVTVVLRIISVNTGEVLLSTGASKTILSTSAGVNMFKFIDLGTKSVEFEAGATVNEPATYAVRIATEAAVADMIKEGAKKKLWKFKTRGK